ncbi:MAG: UvrD-helicase domain-containing protein [Ferruginibacter sp.]
MSNDNTNQPFDPITVALEASNLIEASAGTGKTYSIAILTLRLVLEKKIPIQQVLMVTFTKAAVAELETRIRQFMRNAFKVSQGILINDDTITTIVQYSMNDRAIGQVETCRLLKEAVLFLDETAILTIHSFCQRVLTEFAFETNQVFGPEILTDINVILADRVNAFWRKHITTLGTGLLQQLINTGLSRASLVNVLGNAMSGKTLSPPGNMGEGFLSETHQAALYEEISGFDIRKDTIKSSIINFISTNADAIRSVTEKNTFAKRNMLHLLHDPALFLDAIIDNSDKAYVQKLYAVILSDHEKIVEIEEEKLHSLKTLINQIYMLAIRVISIETDRYKQENNQLGFDDMITKLHSAVVLDNNEFLTGSLRTKYKAAFIDEFQDTDKMQYEIFNRLFSADTILFYIGDPKQSIYAWRKADIFTYFKAADETANRFGMNINYRSSPGFIEGMNLFFLPAPGFDSFYFSGETKSINYTNVTSPAKSPKGELYKDKRVDVPITIFENPNNESISRAVAAQIIQLLGGDNFTIEEKGRHRKLLPSDIGIMVRKNKQAAAIKQILSKYGIPAVTIDDTKLLQSAEARHLLYLLEAVIDINASSINKALLSPLTGFNSATILAMDDELVLNRFKDYQHLWEHEGVFVMLTKFIADYKVKQVLLIDTTENGERIITNTLQLMELLHKTQTQKQFSSLELISWLKRGLEGMEVEGDEFEQRVESDEEAVKIVTIHKSKGLEYNIVFAPFLDLLADTDFEFVTFRDVDTGEYLFSDISLMEGHQLQLTKKQLEQENRRLVYVAVTRAVYKCYINKNTWHQFSQSAIATFVNAIRENGTPLIAFEASPVLPDNFRYLNSSPRLMPAYLQATNFQLAEVNWRKLSYTFLDPGHVATLKSDAAKGLDIYDEFIFKRLRRGANTGNLLHFIFERIDFTDPAHWVQVIEAALKRFMSNPPVEYAIRLWEFLHHVTGTRIRVADSAFCLHDLPWDKRLNELEFDFGVAPFNPDDVTRLSTPGLPFQLRYAKELEGIMNGKIDLFFAHAGKYFILDWKSNFLGDSMTDYSKENIQLAMGESNYHLQYLVYTLAVKKYLRLRVPRFDYATHFGGVIYLFVRGNRKGREEGVFAYRPDESLIERLDKLLSKRVEGVQEGITP